jgi:hypothetical protein
LPPSLPPILPRGTQVVLLTPLRARGGIDRPAGAIGEVVRPPGDPADAYQLRLADGAEVSAKREAFEVLSHYQRQRIDGAPVEATRDGELWNRVMLRVVIGSRAYGLDDERSDTDRRGVYLAPAERQWSLWGVPEQLECDATQECYWELQKFLSLAVKSNPNALEVLWSPLVEHATELGLELLALRTACVSRLAYQTFGGYVLSQFRKLQADLRGGAVKWKHVMHLLRLQQAGIALLRTGELPVHVDEPTRNRLLSVKRGEVPLETCDAWRRELQTEFDAAFAASTLPEQPDYALVNAFLVRCRRHAAAEGSSPLPSGEG